MVDVASLEAGAMATYNCPTGCVLRPSDRSQLTCQEVNITYGIWSPEDPPACDGKFPFGLDGK